ncbi:putative 40S ribosomal protein S7-1 isoform X2 [Capsicum annuum]|nr:putative 40S ribosomal protein S7-1 isoform X2 [Capsicum annuum]KAF3683037.1 putative 40S ribosomal protein S7-1 isoform X2 [Capsicum annuum]
MPSPEDVTYDTKLTTLAIVHIPQNPHNKFTGAGMSANTYNPHVEGKQHSASRLKIQNGPDALQVDPTLYGDTKTRFFVHFQDLVNGNWWLLLGDDNQQIGYWPQKIFTSLANFANNVEWGAHRVCLNLQWAEVFFPIGSTGSDGY